LGFMKCWKKEDEFEVPHYNETTYAMEFDGHLNWNDSTLSAYLNAPRNGTILIADQFQIAAYNGKYQNESLNVLDEAIFGFYDSLMSKYITQGPEFIVFEKASTMLRENGILNRIISQYFDLNSFKPQAEPDEPKVLGLSHLGFGFKMHCFCLFVTLIVFGLEIIFAKLQRCHAISENRKSRGKKLLIKSKISIQLEVLAEIENDGQAELDDKTQTDKK